MFTPVEHKVERSYLLMGKKKSIWFSNEFRSVYYSATCDFIGLTLKDREEKYQHKIMR